MKTAICAIAKNENAYINDWCEWHLNLGFDEIYIFDNNEPDKEFIGNFINKSILNRIHIIPVNHFKQFQKQAYNDFYKNFSSFYDWVTFIDIDEYISIDKKYKNIKEFLLKKEFKDINVIRLNWLIFGDDGKIMDDISIPIYKRIKKAIKNHKYNIQAKCLVRGGLDNIIFNSVHYPTINNEIPQQMNSKGILGTWKIDVDKIDYSECYIKHYMTKTLFEFLNQKYNRTDAALTRILDLKYFWNINEKTQEKLDFIKNYGK